MFEEIRILAVDDLFLVPICLLVLYGFAIRVRTKYKDTVLEKYFLPGLTARFVGTILYTLILGFYYKGGDTTMYYRAMLDLHKAVSDNSDFLGSIYLKSKLDPNEALNSYFMYDGTGITHFYMYQVSNYMVSPLFLPKVIFVYRFVCLSSLLQDVGVSSNCSTLFTRTCIRSWPLPPSFCHLFCFGAAH
jgi:hypothetical protein